MFQFMLSYFSTELWYRIEVHCVAESVFISLNERISDLKQLSVNIKIVIYI